MELKYLLFTANDRFYEVIEDLILIAECKNFSEFKLGREQIFIRLPASIINEKPIGKNMLAYVEPQINMTSSLIGGKTVYKVQISILPDFEERYRGIKVTRCEQALSFTSFIDIIKPCVEWRDFIYDLLKDNENTLPLCQ